MNILLIGSGGREHAIAWALQKSPNTDVLYVAPGNGGHGRKSPRTSIWISPTARRC